MINLINLKLVDILPERLKTKEIIAICKALDHQMQEITKDIDQVLMLPIIDQLPEDIIDSLAWQFHVDFYEPLGLDLDRKRALVKSSLDWHRRKGTKSVLVEMVKLLFLEDFKIEEWFEYGGKPYFFRLISGDSLIDMEKYEDLIRAIYELKNERSWFESVRFNKESQSTVYFGQVGKNTSRYKIGAIKPEIKLDSTTIHFGIATKYTRRFEINAILPQGTIMEQATIYTAIATKNTRSFTIPEKEVNTQIKNTNINTGLAYKHTSRTVIRSSQEVNIDGSI